MQLFINIAQLTVGVIIIGLILIQQRGSGLGGAFGGDSALYTTKRGAEKIVYLATIVFSVIFFALAAVNSFVF